MNKRLHHSIEWIHLNVVCRGLYIYRFLLFTMKTNNTLFHYSQDDERRDSIPEEPENQQIESQKPKLAVPENVVQINLPEESAAVIVPDTIGWKKDITSVENT